MLARLFRRAGRKAPARPFRFRPTLAALEERDVPSGVPTDWSVRGSGGGGSLFSPQINPTNPNEYYVSSDMSQLFHTTDAGATWKTVDFRQLQGNHETRVQYTNDPNILYTLDYTSIDGVDLTRPTRSTNGGATWQPLANDPTGNEAWYFYADPSNSSRLVITDYTNLYFSSNGGQTWSLKYSDSTGAGIVLSGAFWDGSNIYLGTNAGILASSNGGSNFALMSISGIPGTQAIRSFAGSKQGGTTRFLVVTDAVGDVWGGVQGYDNDGGTAVYTFDVGQSSWTARSLPSSAWPFYAGMALTNTGTMYVAGGSSSGVPTVYKSTNGGGTWTSVLLTTNNQNVQTGWSGQGGDRGWGYGELAMGFVVSATDPNQLLISDYGFTHSSTDGGASWKALYVSPADLNPAGSNTPPGQSYHDSGLDNTTSWQVTWADADTMFISNSDVRGQISTDGGETFGFGYTGHTANSMYRVVVGANGTLYGATGTVHDLYQSTYLQDSRIDGGTGSVLFSTNKGLTWQTMHAFNDVVSWVATDPNNPNRLYASVVHSTAGGIYVTDNANLGAASTWTKLTNPPRTEGHPFNIVVLNDGTLVVSYSGRRNSGGAFTASSGVFVSTNGGQSWTDRSASGMLYWTKDVVVDPGDPTQNTWYAGVFSGWGGPPNGLGGLYKTTNRGVSWTRILDLDRVTSATINPNDTNEMFVTTETDGLWYSSNIRSASPTFTQVASYEFRQPERVFYNPYNANEIWVTSFGGGVRVGTTGVASLPGTIQLASAVYAVTEGTATVTLTVNRVGGSDGAVSVNYATANGTASAGSDFTAANGTLSWAAGDSAAKTVVITITNDSQFESAESFTLNLSGAAGGASLGSPSSATVTINDNDPPPPPPPAGTLQFTTNGVSVNEGAGTASVTVSRTGGSFGSVSVSFATANGTAFAPGDFGASNGTLTWADGDTSSKTITVPIVNDASVEANETFSLALSSVTGGAAIGANGTSVVTIVDNDVSPPPPTTTANLGGKAFLDIDADGVKDANDPAISGITVYLDLNNNGILDGSDPSRVSDAAGAYQFNSLAAGNYTVREVLRGATTLTGAAANGSLAIALAGGVDQLAANFGHRLIAPIFPTRTTMNLFTTSHPNSNTAYVYNVFRALLGKDPTAAEVTYHVNALNSGYNRTDYATSIYNRDESLHFQVDQMYRNILKRPADDAGKVFWSDHIRRGLSPEWIVSLLAATGEYQSTHTSNASYIQGLYNDLLCREPTSADIAFWNNFLATRSRFDLAWAFASSAEAYTRAVKDVFVQFLHREATPADVNHWVNLLMKRQVSVSRMSVLLIASSEFAGKAANASG